MASSVIVVAYNSRRYLHACLRSILADLGHDDELIVVDNGSTDGSGAFVREHFPQARLLEGENIGFAAGNNLGAHQAHGEYLVMVNPDTVVRPGAINALVAPLTQPGIALTTARIVHMRQPELVNTCGNTMHYTGLTYCRGANQPARNYITLAEVDAVSGAAFAIRRTVFEELGGFDPHFFMYVEDTDLSLRARLAGYRCVFVPEAIVEHDYRPAYTPAKAFYLDRNRHLMLLKNLKRRTYLRLVPGLLMGELVTWGFLLIKGPRFWGVKLRVYRALWANRRYIRLARRAAHPQPSNVDSEVLGRMTWRLDFGQLANRMLASAAAAVFHPPFWAARLLISRGRA